MQPVFLVPSGTICCCVSGLAGLPQSSRSTWRFDHPCSSHVSDRLWRFHETRAAHNVARQVRGKTTKSCNIRNNCNTAIYDKPTTKWWWNCCPIFSSFTDANELSGMLSTLVSGMKVTSLLMIEIPQLVLYHIPVVCLSGKIHHHKEIAGFQPIYPSKSIS